MNNVENLNATRILVLSLLFGLAVMAYTLHVHYSEEISDKVETLVGNTLLDMERDLAKL